MKRQERDALAKEVILREIISIRNEFLVLSSRKFFQLITQNLPTSMPAGRDAFFRMMGANSLLIKKRKSYRPITTISQYHFHKFTNLWKGGMSEGPNLVWVADITYIRLWNGTFVHLSLLTDVYSHKIVGWHLSDRLEWKVLYWPQKCQQRTCQKDISWYIIPIEGCNIVVKLMWSYCRPITYRLV